MRVLLTGATGYLGGHLLRALAARGDSCVCLKRSTSRLGDAARIPGAVSFVDIGHDMETAVAGAGPFDAVVHLAASYGRKGESASHVATSNILLTVRLLELARALAIPMFLYASTTIERFTGPYSLSKLQAAEWGRLLAQTGGPRFVELKLEHFYGPADDPTKFTSFLFGALVRREPEIALSPGDQVRDFIYIDDAVSALLAIMDHEAASQHPVTSWSVGSGQGVTLQSFAKLARQVINSPSTLCFGARPYRPNETMRSVADIIPLRALGWEPRVPLAEGIARSVSCNKKSETT